MTMATYCKKRLSKTSSRSAKKERITRSLVKNEVPSDNDDIRLLRAATQQCNAVNINNSSRLCNENRNDNCYEVLEAVGLVRVDVKCEHFVDVEETVLVEEEQNNDNVVEIENKIVFPQDDNNNTKSVTKTKLHKCTKCNLTFRSLITYNQHRKKNHPRSKILYCKICSKTFKNSELLLKHKKCHSGRKPYCCVQCNKRLGSLQALTAHIRRHAGKLPYTCKVCKMGFDLYSDFIDHQQAHLLRKSEYPKLKIYKCHNCPKEFRKFCDLERHTRVHTGEKPYSCNICKNRFQQAHNLTKHMIIHTKEKQYKCEICQKEFGRSDVLTRHMITHSVNKPHPCDYCEKSFGRFSQLLDHVKKHHSDIQ